MLPRVGAAILSRVDETRATPASVPEPRRGGLAGAIVPGLFAALTWGLSPAILKRWAGEELSVLVRSGWMNAAAGLALTIYLAVRPRERRGPPIERADLPWLAGATLCGAVVGPFALLRGLELAPAHVASLLLNFEVVATAVLAAVFFGEPATRRRIAGVVLVTAGGAVVAGASPPSAGGGDDPMMGGLWIALACVAWALDNNLTRRIAQRDAPTLARAKLLVGGMLSLLLAVALGAFPSSVPVRDVVVLGAVGAIGVGASLALFIVSLRRVGAARTSVIFGTAPFVGAVAAALILHERFSPWTLVAAVAMAAGVALVATEPAADPAPSS